MNKYSEIADGLASWLTFEQRCGRESLFCESYLSNPIGQLLQYQYSNRVLSEITHPVLAERQIGVGKKPSVDFAVAGNGKKYNLVIETKWISKSPTLLRDILRDVVRLDLLLYKYAEEAVIIVAGKKKDFVKLFEDSQFRPHPNHLNSNHILPLENHHRASIRFVPVPKFRRKLYSQVLSVFEEIEIAKSIPIERSGPFPRNANTTHYEVYIWRIKKFYETERFKIDDYYQIKTSVKRRHSSEKTDVVYQERQTLTI